jgi:hypothetical protein
VKSSNDAGLSAASAAEMGECSVLAMKSVPRAGEAGGIFDF